MFSRSSLCFLACFLCFLVCFLGFGETHPIRVAVSVGGGDLSRQYQWAAVPVGGGDLSRQCPWAAVPVGGGDLSRQCPWEAVTSQGSGEAGPVGLRHESSMHLHGLRHKYIIPLNGSSVSPNPRKHNRKLKKHARKHEELLENTRKRVLERNKSTFYSFTKHVF